MAKKKPSRFTLKIAEEICDRVAKGESVRSICRDEHMPFDAVVFNWVRKRDAFNLQYTRAKEVACDRMEDEIFDITDDSTNDYMERYNKKTGEMETAVNHENIQRAKLRIDTRKWYLGKIRRKKYGDKLEISGDSDKPIVVKSFNDFYSKD